jgi:hypothetical protein
MNEEFMNEYKDMRKGGEVKTWGLTDGYTVKGNKKNFSKENRSSYNEEFSTEFLNTNGEVLRAFKDLDYANLGANQEAKLRQLERQFNEEFGTDFYFMVMKQEEK